MARIGVAAVVLAALTGALAAADPLTVAQQAGLVASDGLTGGDFGLSLAVGALGLLLALGLARRRRRGLGAFVLVVAAGAAPALVSAGPTVWERQADPLPAERSCMGGTVYARAVLSGDSLALCDRGLEDAEGRQTGGVCVYARSPGGRWREQAVVRATPPGQIFSCPLALAGDWLAVGEQDEDYGGFTRAGVVWLFHRAGEEWAPAGQLVATHLDHNIGFGRDLAMHDDVLIVATVLEHGAYVYVRTDDAWPAEPQFEGYGYPSTVAIDTGAAVVGHRTIGQASVLVRDGLAWHEAATLLPRAGEVADTFGWSVAISAGTAAVGLGGGPVYLFGQTSGWQEVAYLQGPTASGCHFGETLSLSGDLLLVGMPCSSFSDIGAVGVFARVDGAWGAEAQLDAPVDETMPGDFGQQVVLDGTTAMIQGSRDLYLYGRGAARGSACTADAECASGSCIDGYCCESPCDEPCRRCDAPGSEGTCTPRASDADEDACAGWCDVQATCVTLPAAAGPAGCACAAGSLATFPPTGLGLLLAVGLARRRRRRGRALVASSRRSAPPSCPTTSAPSAGGTPTCTAGWSASRRSSG